MPCLHSVDMMKGEVGSPGLAPIIAGWHCWLCMYSGEVAFERGKRQISAHKKQSLKQGWMVEGEKKRMVEASEDRKLWSQREEMEEGWGQCVPGDTVEISWIIARK